MNGILAGFVKHADPAAQLALAADPARPRIRKVAPKPRLTKIAPKGPAKLPPLLPHQADGIDFIVNRSGGSGLISWPTGAGKAQPLDATVWTPSGPKRMGDIRVGDVVCTPDGGAARVTGVFPQGEKDIFRISFSDGSSAEACDEHLWRVSHVDWSEPRILSTKQVAARRYFKASEKTPGGPRSGWSMYERRKPCLRMRIDVTKPVSFERREVGVDPYLLGVLLGDGCIREGTVSLTTSDVEILSEVAWRLPPKVQIKPVHPPYDYALTCGNVGGGRNPLVKALRKYGLTGKRSEHKFIPDDYLYNSVDVRLQVLQGLMDTDGTVTKRSGQAAFYSTSKRLADQVVWIVQSLGGIALLSSKVGKYRKADGTIRECLRCYRVAINVVDVASLFRLSRKRQKAVSRTKYPPKRFIRSIELSRRAKAQCIAIDHPGHLYLTNDFVVTHNTRGAAVIGSELRAKGGRTLFVTPASLKTNMAKGVAQWTPGTSIQVLKKGDDVIQPKAQAAVISYELFKKRSKDLAKAGFDTAIFDEFHKAKDESSDTYKQIAAARPLFKNYVGLTASLNSLDPTDMLQPINAITGGKHGFGTEAEFRRRFLRTKGETASVFLRMRPQWNRTFGQEVVGFKNEDALGEEMRKHIHYVAPEDLDPKLFPKKDVQTVRVEMAPEQTKLYRYALRQLPPGATAALHSSSPNQMQVSQLYNHLIQTRALSGGVHTMLKGMSLSDSARLTPKARKALDDIETHLKEVGDGRVIITTNLVAGGVDVLTQGLKDRGIPSGVFMGKGKGGTPEKQRQQALKDFNDGKLKVLVVSQAGHEGIDAPNTTMVAAYDGHFNPERILQAEARGIRANGLKSRKQADRRVVVRRYVSVVPESRGLIAGIKRVLGLSQRERSIDERIYDIASKRNRLNKGMLDILRGHKPREQAQL